jgi:hypothetical protein
LGKFTPSGEEYLLCGHFDRLVKFNTKYYVLDRKTTKSTISDSYFSMFSPDNQFTLYTFAGQVACQEPVAGLICDAAQVAVNFSRFERRVIDRHPATVSEWVADLGFWIGSIENCALNQHYPMNEKSCGNYGGCEFRSICGKAPAVREQWIKGAFDIQLWNPLETRGDI